MEENLKPVWLEWPRKSKVNLRSPTRLIMGMLARVHGSLKENSY